MILHVSLDLLSVSPLDVRNVTFEPGIYWLGSGHRLKVLVRESASVTAKKTLSDEGTDCPDLLDIVVLLLTS